MLHVAMHLELIAGTYYNRSETFGKEKIKRATTQRRPETNYNRTTLLLRQRERLCLAR